MNATPQSPRTRRLSGPAVRAGALFLLWAATGCDLFAPRPGGQIRVVTTPPGATVTCNGVLQESAPAVIDGLTPGSYLVSASAPGYRDARQTVDLLKDQRVAITLTLEPLLGLALVESNPSGADVTVDGAWRGKTPFFLTDLSLGAHRFEFNRTGYLPRQMELTVEGRAPSRVVADLVSNTGILTVRSQPEGAQVFLNGALKGVAPLEIPEVPAGANRVDVQLEGYLPFSEQLVMEVQGRRAVVAELQVIPSRLTVVSIPAGARLYVADQYRGETPITLTDLPVGSHRLRVELRGYDIMARHVSVSHDAPRTEEFRLSKNSGKLVIVSEPAQAAVFLNGQEYGRTGGEESARVSDPLEIDLLPPGEYRVQLVRTGYLHTPRVIRMTANQVVELYEKLARRYAADTQVRMRGQVGEIVRVGMLVEEFPNGDIELQLETGTIMKIRAEEILVREPLRTVSP
ncbi:MAG: PEGA domain-containing protein [Kiritimatiellia bacterium]|nr:PEGA domain-containing protein [Kiritimatiellia bacterium]